MLGVSFGILKILTIPNIFWRGPSVDDLGLLANAGDLVESWCSSSYLGALEAQLCSLLIETLVEEGSGFLVIRVDICGCFGVAEKPKID